MFLTTVGGRSMKIATRRFAHIHICEYVIALPWDGENASVSHHLRLISNECRGSALIAGNPQNGKESFL
jgi:hypothetical protein